MPPDSKPPDVVARSASVTVDELVAQHAIDVGEGGMLLRASSSVPVGKLVDFEVRLADDKVALSGAGRIVWKRDALEGERPAGVAVKFVDLDETSQALVDRLVAARKEEKSEFDRPPEAPAPARTVMGLGIGPAPFSRKEVVRAATALGLAPAVVPASLVLDEQSSPAIPTQPAPGASATSDIDQGWVDEPQAPEPTVAAEPQPAVETETPLAAAAVEPPQAPVAPAVEPPPEARVTPAVEAPPEAPVAAAEPPPKATPAKRREQAPPAAPAEETPPPQPPERGAWPWIGLVLVGVLAGVYFLRDAFQDPEAAPSPPSATAASAPSPPPAPIPSAPASSTTASTAAAAPPAPSSATPSAPAPSASAIAPAQPDAGKAQAPASSAKAAHGAPAASASAKPHRPKPKPVVEDNPY
jgi:uncharacterized protein (TIGR02266 family)